MLAHISNELITSNKTTDLSRLLGADIMFHLGNRDMYSFQNLRDICFSGRPAPSHMFTGFSAGESLFFSVNP